MIRNGIVAPLGKERPDIPTELVDVVHRALAKDEAERFSGARAMGIALAECMQGHGASVDTQTLLGIAVHNAREELGMKPLVDNAPTFSFVIDESMAFGTVPSSTPAGDADDS